MKAKGVRLHAANDLRLEEFELPEITDDEILYCNHGCRRRVKMYGAHGGLYCGTAQAYFRRKHERNIPVML